MLSANEGSADDGKGSEKSMASFWGGRRGVTPRLRRPPEQLGPRSRFLPPVPQCETDRRRWADHSPSLSPGEEGGACFLQGRDGVPAQSPTHEARQVPFPWGGLYQ